MINYILYISSFQYNSFVFMHIFEAKEKAGNGLHWVARGLDHFRQGM